MIAIVLAVLIIAGMVAVVYYFGSDDMPGLGIFLSVVILLVGGTVGVLILTGIASGFPVQRTETHALRALTNGSSESGSFFLGSGYVDQKQVFNYVEDHDGYSTLESVDADQSRVYQDEAANPRVEVWGSLANAWWLAPFDVSGFEDRYDFHIPNGSIDNTYAVKP